MQIPPLSPALEAELFATALEFRLAQPWKVLDNTHYLLVAEPTGGRRSITVLGAGRQQYGMQAFDADTAARFLYLSQDVAHGIVDAGWALDMFSTLRGVELELLPKNRLSAPELLVSWRHDYRPKPGMRHAWPVMRQFRPGFFAGDLDEAAAQVLLADLRRALRWAELKPQVEKELGPLPCPLDERALPVVEADLPTDRPWTAEDLRWETLDRMEPSPPVPVPLGEAEVQVWQSTAIDTETVWLVEERVLPHRLAYPGESLHRYTRLAIVLDAAEGRVIAHGMEEAGKGQGHAALKALTTLAKAVGKLPNRVIVDDAHLHHSLAQWREVFPAQVFLAPTPPPGVDDLWDELRRNLTTG